MKGELLNISAVILPPFKVNNDWYEVFLGTIRIVYYGHRVVRFEIGRGNEAVENKIKKLLNKR